MSTAELKLNGTTIISESGGTADLQNLGTVDTTSLKINGVDAITDSVNGISFNNSGIADDSISGDKIDGGTISGVTLASDTNFGSIADDSISGDKIHEGFITHTDTSLSCWGLNGFYSRSFAYISNKDIGWYTVAVNSGDRAGALFEVGDTRSSNHSHRSFYAGHMYGNMSRIYVYGNVSYSGGGAIRYARIMEGGTYDGAMLQIYVDVNTSNVGIMIRDHMITNGWTLVNWVPDGTDPGGLNNYSALTNQASIVDFNTNGFVYS